MSERWEESIHEWYTKSHTANLEYLDLSTTTKVSTNQLAHNLSIVYDKTCLSSRVHIKHLKQLLEKTRDLEARVNELEDSIKNLTALLLNNITPTTTTEALLVTKELNNKLSKVEEILQKN